MFRTINDNRINTFIEDGFHFRIHIAVTQKNKLARNNRIQSSVIDEAEAQWHERIGVSWFVHFSDLKLFPDESI